MKSDIVEAFSAIAKEKNIEKEVLGEILESTILGIIKKKYGKTDNFDIFVSLDKGEIEIYQNKTIVEEVIDEVEEVDLESARKVEPDLEIGDEFIEIIDPKSFGRRLIVSAKQNLNQKIKDAEKEILYEEFKNRVGEIIVGDVRQIYRDELYLNIEKTEVILPKSEQIHTERYRRGDHVRAIISAVEKTNRGLEIIISRASPKILIRLFELEVPEIYDGIIEIKRVAREPGERAKIAVLSNDKRIDALGACVGMKGIRIQSISKELNNEKIDVINWHGDPGIFIARALSPAKVYKVIVDQNKKKAIAVLTEDQISLAIGRGGQNRRLASRLAEYDIEIIKESEYTKIMEGKIGTGDSGEDLKDLKGLTPGMLKKLTKAGLSTIEEVEDAGVEGLSELPGIGEKTAKKIIDLVKNN
ncbi:transcription termination factor NusA [candidate division KSB1 bacterium]|nr:transcription termination factor NusA [candidate division KSB1 bacterium]